MSLDRVVFQSSCGECLGFDECSLRHVEGNEADMRRVVAVLRRGLSPPVVLSNQACDDSNTLHPQSVTTFSSSLRNTLVIQLARSSILNFYYCACAHDPTFSNPYRRTRGSTTSTYTRNNVLSKKLDTRALLSVRLRS